MVGIKGMRGHTAWNKGLKPDYVQKENHPMWKGDSAGYVAIHMWLKKYYGKPDRCENDPTHKAKRFEWANTTGTYTRNIKDYQQLCPSCHRRMDWGNFCKAGHEFTEESTRWHKEGYRICKICSRNWMKQFRERRKIKLSQ